VLFVDGKDFAHKFVASGNYFLTLERDDGLKVFIWLNKMVNTFLFSERLILLMTIHLI
jgi:hypothetical protein